MVEPSTECYSMKDIGQMVALADQANKRGLNTILCSLSKVLDDLKKILNKSCKRHKRSSWSRKYENLKEKIGGHRDEVCCKMEGLGLNDTRPYQGDKVCTVNTQAAQSVAQTIGISVQ